MLTSLLYLFACVLAVIAGGLWIRNMVDRKQPDWTQEARGPIR